MKNTPEEIIAFVERQKETKLLAGYSGNISQLPINSFDDLMNTVKTTLNLNKEISFQEVVAVIPTEMTLSIENEKLKFERAQLSIDSLILKGILEPENRGLWIKLATNNYELVMTMIAEKYSNKIEAESLLKLSADELYMSGKLERLKEVSYGDFLLMYKKIFGVDY